jgi:hypothetical protein
MGAHRDGILADVDTTTEDFAISVFGQVNTIGIVEEIAVLCVNVFVAEGFAATVERDGLGGVIIIVVAVVDPRYGRLDSSRIYC